MVKLNILLGKGKLNSRRKTDQHIVQSELTEDDNQEKGDSAVDEGVDLIVCLILGLTSAILRRCLNVAGSSMLTFRVLPH